MSIPVLFNNTNNFKQQFNQGLARLLAEDDGLESSILVLANALFDKEIFAPLAPALKQRFTQLATNNTDAHYQPLFEQIAAQGIEALATVHQQQGLWELQYNPLRSFRPARASAAKTVGLQTAFNPEGFHFNKPFLAKETLWQGELMGRDAKLLYNKFPFVALHGLLVLDASKQRPQYLQGHDHSYIWQLLSELSEGLPDLSIAYNSYGAYASVNHLHFQTFIRKDLPIAAECWQHNGGDKVYPLACQVYEDKDKAWQAVQDLHAAKQPYNLIYLAQKVYVCPRQRQGTHPHPEWSHAFAWYEVSGGFSCTSKEALRDLSTRQIEQSLEGLNTLFAM